MADHEQDLVALRAVREAFVAADNANDDATLIRLLAEDVVILHPRCGIITGHAAAARFLGDVLGEIKQQFSKRATYSTLELRIAADFAYERGELLQELQPQAGGPAEYDRGQYLWVYTRDTEGRWRISRIAGAFEMPTDEERSCVE